MAVLLAVTLLAACETPRYAVVVDPLDAQLYIDGSAAPAPGAYHDEIPYYGTMAVTSVPSAADSMAGRRTTRTELEIEPPVSKWLFPVDFLIELGVAAAGSATQTHEIQLRADDRTERIVEGTRPRGIEALRDRAEAFAAQR